MKGYTNTNKDLELIKNLNQIINFGLNLPDDVYNREQLFMISQFKLMYQQIFFDNNELISSTIKLGKEITNK